jgi:hypothetical protein
LDNGNKAGIGAGLAALLLGAAHFGDDLLRGVGRAVRESPAPRIIDDVAPPLADGASSALQAPMFDSAPRGSGQVSVAFREVVADSAARLAKSRSGLVRFEIASGKLRIGSDRRLSRHVIVGHREINLYSTAAIAGTPLALCWASLDKTSEVALRRCVDKALDEMTGAKDESRHF